MYEENLLTIKSLPTFFSLSRILLTPIILWCLTFNSAQLSALAFGLFTLAALTDFIDGYLARKFNAVTSWGVFFDPLADKILIQSLLIFYVVVGKLVWAPVSLILMREVFMTLIRIFVGVRAKPVPASLLGKLKVILQCALLSALMLDLFSVLWFWLSWLIVFITLWSLVSYVRMLDKLILYEFFGTVSGLGYSPIMPGTVGSLFGLLLWWYIPTGSWFVYGALCLVLFALGVFVTGQVAQFHDTHDPSYLVIDEVVGQLIALALVPHVWSMGFVGFVFFRFFDISKFWPVCVAEKLPGGWGIMTDDIVAGALARVTIMVLVVLW